MHGAWEAGLRERVEARAAARHARQRLRGQPAEGEAAADGATAEAEAAGVTAKAGGDAGASTGDGGGGGGAAEASSRHTWSKLLPGGLTVEVCKAWQRVPGPETHAAIEWLRAQVASGEMRSGQPYEYYLDALGEAGRMPAGLAAAQTSDRTGLA